MFLFQTITGCWRQGAVAFVRRHVPEKNRSKSLRCTFYTGSGWKVPRSPQFKFTVRLPWQRSRSFLGFQASPPMSPGSFACTGFGHLTHYESFWGKHEWHVKLEVLARLALWPRDPGQCQATCKIANGAQCAIRLVSQVRFRDKEWATRSTVLKRRVT